MPLDDEFRIETPEQIELGLELAGLGTRFLAQMVDWAIKLLVSILIFLSYVIIMSLLGKDVDRLFRTSSQLVTVLCIVLFFGLWLGYDILFETRNNGQTPGKKAAGARVVRDTGSPIDFNAASIRNLLGLADFLPLAYLCGSLLILLTPRRQRLGDLAAGTIVVRDREAGHTPVNAQPVIELFTGESIKFTALQLNQFSGDDRQIIRSFFQRFKSMPPKQRGDLALRLIHTYFSRINEPLEPDITAERAFEILADLSRQLDQFNRSGY